MFTPFSTVFQLYHSGQCTYPCFPGFHLHSIPHNILFKLLAAFPLLTIVETTDSGDRGMNPVAVTIVNPRKEYWLSRGWTSDLLFSSLQCYWLRYRAQAERVLASYGTNVEIRTAAELAQQFSFSLCICGSGQKTFHPAKVFAQRSSAFLQKNLKKEQDEFVKHNCPRNVTWPSADE